jgi:hypothetical protein
MTLYTTHAQAKADTARLSLEEMIGIVPFVLLGTIERVVLNPHSNSDTLLICADALREAASPFAGLPQGLALARLADAIANLAPSRATAITQQHVTSDGTLPDA